VLCELIAQAKLRQPLALAINSPEDQFATVQHFEIRHPVINATSDGQRMFIETLMKTAGLIDTGQVYK